MCDIFDYTNLVKQLQQSTPALMDEILTNRHVVIAIANFDGCNSYK